MHREVAAIELDRLVRRRAGSEEGEVEEGRRVSGVDGQRLPVLDLGVGEPARQLPGQPEVEVGDLVPRLVEQGGLVLEGGRLEAARLLQFDTALQRRGGLVLVCFGATRGDQDRAQRADDLHRQPRPPAGLSH